MKIFHQRKYQSTYSADKRERGEPVQIAGAQGSRSVPRAQVSFICSDSLLVYPAWRPEQFVSLGPEHTLSSPVHISGV